MKSRMLAGVILFVAMAKPGWLPAEELVQLRGKQTELVWAAAGGALIAFRFHDDPTNPLNFEVTPDIEQRRDNAPFLRGHFVCLDRWGAPSKAEEARGVPFHGEAPRIVWTVDRPPTASAGMVTAEMSCVLPLARMRVARRIALDEAGSVALVTESVTNTNNLARIYNLVQHPSIAPPFLNDGTLVDANAAQGFVQDDPVPTARDAGLWPQARLGGSNADLRQFRDSSGNESGHDVSSFVFAEGVDYGWVTACSPKHRLLLGYLWRTAEYPWLNIWRYRRDGKPVARGLEFGTTGYHQPFPILVRQGTIFGRRTFEPLDADETVARSYLCFLARTPADFQGVSDVRLDGDTIRLHERRTANPRYIDLRTELRLPKQ